MVRPTMGRDCSWSTAATVEESTPPDMAMATRPGCVSTRSGSDGSNWVEVDIRYASILPFCRVVCREDAGLKPGATSIAASGFTGVGGREFAEVGDGGRNGFAGEVNVRGGGVAAQAEAET